MALIVEAGAEGEEDSLPIPLLLGIDEKIPPVWGLRRRVLLLLDVGVTTTHMHARFPHHPRCITLSTPHRSL